MLADYLAIANPRFFVMSRRKRSAVYSSKLKKEKKDGAWKISICPFIFWHMRHCQATDQVKVANVLRGGRIRAPASLSRKI